LTLTDLAYKMRGYLWDEDSVPYGNQYLKHKLKTHYGDAMYTAEREGVQSVVTMIEKRHRFCMLISKVPKPVTKKVKSYLS